MSEKVRMKRNIIVTLLQNFIALLHFLLTKYVFYENVS